MTKLLLVHGAWHNGAGFARLQDELRSRGIESETIELSSVARSDEEIGDMYRDAQLVRERIDGSSDDYFVLAHSYGGLPVTQGLVGASNVKGLIFLTAFVLDENETLFAACGSQDPAWWVRNSDNTRLTTANPVDVFYNTCAPDVASAAASQLRTHSLASFNQPITAVSWKSIPSTYIICERDNAIPVFAQEAMSARCTSVRRIDSDHSPFLSSVTELGAMIESIIRAG